MTTPSDNTLFNFILTHWVPFVRYLQPGEDPMTSLLYDVEHRFGAAAAARVKEIFGGD